MSKNRTPSEPFRAGFLASDRMSVDRPLRIYLWLAFGITWGVGGLALLTGDIPPGGASPLHPLHYVAAFGPSIAGVIMAASTDGWAGVRRMLARVVPSRSALPWYVAVLIGFPVLNLVAARLLAPDFLSRLPPWPWFTVRLSTAAGSASPSTPRGAWKSHVPH